MIFGVFNISVMSGGAAGPLLTGFIFDMTHSYQLAFILCAVISLIGIILTVFLKMGRVKKKCFEPHEVL
jgi:MFS family permease